MTGRLALGAVLLGAGILWLLTAADIVQLAYQTWIGLLLVAIGLAIVVTPGRHVLLVVAGILVVLAGLPALVVDEKVFQGGVGDEIEAPTSDSDLEPYRHAIGKLTVDLTASDLDLDGSRVEASIGIGELVVLVPNDTDVALDVHVGIGNAEALGRTESGIDVDVVGLSGTSGSQEFALQLDAGIGNVRVERSSD